MLVIAYNLRMARALATKFFVRGLENVLSQFLKEEIQVFSESFNLQSKYNAKLDLFCVCKANSAKSLFFVRLSKFLIKS